jgi:WD40 repeat protein
VVAPKSGAKSEPVSPRLLKTLMHTNRQALIGTVFFAPDGKWIAGCGLISGDIQVWEAMMGKQLRHITIPEHYISQYDPLPSPPDGHTLYVPIRREQSTRITKEGHPAIHWEVDGEIQAWNLATGRKLPPLRHTPPRSVREAALTSDGNWLAAVERRVNDEGNRIKDVLTLWDVRTRTARDLAEGCRYGIPRFAPDSKTLAAPFMDGESKRSALALWDAASGKRRTILHSAADSYGGPVFSPDGHYVAVSLNMPKKQVSEVKLWEVATGKEISAFTAPEGVLDFLPLAFSPDGRRLAATTPEGGKVFLYDVQDRKLLWVREIGKQVRLRDPVFSPDGKWLAVPGQPLPEGIHNELRENPLELPQPRVFLFDLTAGSDPEVIVAPHGFVGRAAFSPDGRILALGGYGCVWLFDVSKANLQRRSEPRP